MIVNEYKMNSRWQKGNDAKFGFFPTSLEVVKMEMELIDISEVSANIPLPIADFTGGTGEQLKAMYDYIKEQGLSPVAYYNELAEERYRKALEQYGKMEGFHLCNSDIFYLSCVHTERRKMDKKTMAIIRNNPPYTFLKMYGDTVRAEEAMFLENERYNVTGGIQIFELPIHQLKGIKNLMTKIAYRYQNINIFKFPKGEFEKFKQVVVIGERKKENSRDIETAEYWLEKIHNNALKSLDEVDKPIYKLTDTIVKRCKPVTVFRDSRVTDETLSKGLEMCLETLMQNRRNKRRHSIYASDKGQKPIIETTTGHRAVLLNAGKFNGIKQNVLIAGGVKKVVEVQEEVDKNKVITTEIEKLVPFVEITNKNGDILLKDG